METLNISNLSVSNLSAAIANRSRPLLERLFPSHYEKTQYILAVDGGGVRGAIASSVLKLIEQRILKRPVYEVFTRFVGTSTGCFISAGLASRKLTATEICDQIYTYETTQKIFTKTWLYTILPFDLFFRKYIAEEKTRILRQFFGDQTFKDLPENVKLVIATENWSKKSPTLWHNFSLEGTPQARIADICDASSAAPTFFPPIQIFFPDHVELVKETAAAAKGEKALLTIRDVLEGMIHTHPLLLHTQKEVLNNCDVDKCENCAKNVQKQSDISPSSSTPLLKKMDGSYYQADAFNAYSSIEEGKVDVSKEEIKQEPETPSSFSSFSSSSSSLSPKCPTCSCYDQIPVHIISPTSISPVNATTPQTSTSPDSSSATLLSTASAAPLIQQSVLETQQSKSYLDISKSASPAESGDVHVDGGLNSNTPSTTAFAFCQHDNIQKGVANSTSVFLLSLGTGSEEAQFIHTHESRLREAERLKSMSQWGILSWLWNGVVSRSQESPNQINCIDCALLMQDNFLRIDGSLPKHVPYTMDFYSREHIQNLKEVGEQWFYKNEQELVTFFSFFKE